MKSLKNIKKYFSFCPKSFFRFQDYFQRAFVEVNKTIFLEGDSATLKLSLVTFDFLLVGGKSHFAKVASPKSLPCFL